ncbi:MAG: hypothetical protein ACYC23_19300, partial [Limisphaerales bacterium]
VEELATSPPVASASAAKAAVATPPAAPAGRVYCLPARAERDELAGTMLVHLLQQEGFEAESVPSGLEVGEMIERVRQAGADIVCISVVTPSTAIHARHLCLKLRPQLPEPRIVVGLWGATGNLTDVTGRIRASGGDYVVTTFADALRQMGGLASTLTEPERAAALRVGDEPGASG